MKNFCFSLILSAAAVGCVEDKAIDTGVDDGFNIGDADADSDSDADADADADADSDADADADADGPFNPVAIGVEFSGVWDEASGELLDYYLMPDVEGGGEPTAYFSAVVITLATADYFGAESDAAQEGEYCEMLGYFRGDSFSTLEAYDMNTQEYDWENYGGGSGELVDEWMAWEGGITIIESSIDARCYDWEDADAYTMFNNMHYGLGFGPLSSHMTSEFGDFDWWDSETDAFTYFSMYTAMNHPNEESALGYDFVGYDWNYGVYINADASVCQDLVDEETDEIYGEACGLVSVVDGDEGPEYGVGNFNVDVGSRYAYVQSGAWWYEDFPNLDLSIIGEGYTP